MHMRILIIEDDKDIRMLIAFHLKAMGADVLEADNGNDALSIIGKGGIDLAILDIMLPGLSGIDVLRSIRENGPEKELPVIVASALDSESDIISALEEGADDYITKPFSPKILTARVRSLLRRTSPKGHIISTAKGVTLDTGKRRCFVLDEEVQLTATEFDILSLLISADGCVRKRTEIIEEVKGDDYPVTERSIDVQIASLRKKLGKAGKYIATVWGIGYRYAEE